MIRGHIAADKVLVQEPERFKKIQSLKKTLCSLACPEDGTVMPEMCEKCDCQCGYGKRLLVLWADPNNRPKKRGRKPKREA